MVRPTLTSDRGTQPVLLPMDARDLLPADYLVWEVLAQVDELDLHELYAAHRGDGVGRPPYDPAMMVALLYYCARKGFRGGHAVEEACIADLGCRVITGNTKPDHSTIDRFIDTHGAALRSLLPQSLRLCDEAGLIDLALIAGDHTKFAANAAMRANVDEATLRRQIADLREQIAQVEAQWQAAVTDEATDTPPLFDLDLSPSEVDLSPSEVDLSPSEVDLSPSEVDPPATTSPTTAPPLTERQAWRRLKTLHRLLHARQAALQHLTTRPSTDRTEWEARLARDQARVTRRQESLDALKAKVQAAYDKRQQAEAAGARVPGTRPVPPDQHAHVRKAQAALAKATARARDTAANPPDTGKVNTTDPHSRIMPTKHGGYDQMFNAGATACASQVILAVTLHDSPNDKQALKGLFAATRSNLDRAGIDRPIGVALFDSGYASEENFTADLPVELVLIAVEREARQTGRLNDNQSTAAASWQAMATRLDDPANKKLYKRRGAIIEPVFAQLFNHFDHNLHLRGEHVLTELHLMATSHNLGKLTRHRRAAAARAERATRPPG